MRDFFERRLRPAGAVKRRNPRSGEPADENAEVSAKSNVATIVLAGARCNGRKNRPARNVNPMAFKELKTNHQDRELFPYSEDVTPPEDGCVRHVRTQRHRRVACNRFAKNVAVSIPFYESTDDPVTDRYRSFYANTQRPWPGQRLTRNPDWTTESRDNGGSAQPDTGDTPVSPRAPATLSATLRAAAIRERLTAHRARRSADRSSAR